MYDIWMAIVGYVGALLTALYTFRLIFRVLPGKPCPEAQELIDTGHVVPRPPRSTRRPERSRTPTSASPAPTTTSPSSRGRCAVAMARARLPRALRRPGPGAGRRRRRSSSFLDPVFADSPLSRDPPLGRRRVGAASRSARAISLLGIGIACCSTCARPELPAMLIRQRLRPLHTSLVNKWYFDEAIDFLDRAPGAGDRPLRQPHLRAPRRRRPRQRHQGDRRRRRRHRPRRAERLRAQLRAAR